MVGALWFSLVLSRLQSSDKAHCFLHQYHTSDVDQECSSALPLSIKNICVTIHIAAQIPCPSAMYLAYSCARVGSSEKGIEELHRCDRAKGAAADAVYNV